MNSQVLFGLSAKYIIGLQISSILNDVGENDIYRYVDWRYEQTYTVYVAKGEKWFMCWQLKLTAVCGKNVMLLHYLPRLHCSRTFPAK